jgi:hypothetical protein
MRVDVVKIFVQHCKVLQTNTPKAADCGIQHFSKEHSVNKQVRQQVSVLAHLNLPYEPPKVFRIPELQMLPWQIPSLGCQNSYEKL